ncbi:hypothetical protein BBJ28_00007362, partial [Nothophytophthora sp. Chile5]
MCGKNDDPLTTGQGYRTIQLTVGASTTALAGFVRIHFLGDVVTLNANAEVPADAEEACESAFESMRYVLQATCTVTAIDPITKGAVYTVKFTEWTHLGAENNLLYHSGNPPLSSFTCDLSKVTSANAPTCVIIDVAVTDVIEHVYCSNRGLCDFSTGLCVCYADFKGMDCNQPSNIPDSIDDNDGFVINPMGLQYTGTVLHLITTKGSQGDFYFMKIESSTLPILTMDGLGDTKLLHGDFQVSTGSIIVTTIGQTVAAVDITSTHATFTGTTLNVRASRAAASSFKLFEAMSGGTTTVVAIRGDGRTTIQTGGLEVVTGGATISHDLNADTLTVSNTNSAFTGAVLALDSTRTSQYPGTDFLLIDGKANGVTAFTVEASGKTTIANGGGQISNANVAADVLVVSATNPAFTGDALFIQTVSTVSHMMLKATAQISGSSVDVVTISNTGLTTITQGGLRIKAGGASIDAGGLYITANGETIQTGGLHIINGGQVIDAGGLVVTDGGASIASLSTNTDILTVEATATTFSSGAKLLHINSKSTLGAQYYLLYAEAANIPIFTVFGTGRTEINAGGLFVKAGLEVIDTGLTVTDGGATISDSSATADSLSVVSTASTFTGAVLALDSVDTGAFTLIDGKVGTNPVFTVASTGGTTIAGGGLSVTTGGLTVSDGGATISDSSATADSLSVVNTASTFTGAVLALDSVDTGAFTLIDGKVGTNPVFTVASTGGTTIAGGGLSVTTGGLTVSDGGATISDSSATADSLSVVNTASTFTGAVLALDSVDTGAFTLIDGKVGTNPVFTVASTGETTIAGLLIGSAGASITGGATITGGLIADALTVSTTADVGGLLTASAGASITGGATITGGLIADALTVSTTADVGGLLTASAGASITGGATITGGLIADALTVSTTADVGGLLTASAGASITGGATITGGLIADALTVSTAADVGGLLTADSLTVITTADVGGLLTASAGASITGGATITGGLIADALTVSTTADVGGLLTASAGASIT